MYSKFIMATHQNHNRVNQIYVSRKHLIYYMKNLGFDVEKYEQFTLAEINAMDSATKTGESQLDFEVHKQNEDGTMETCSIKYHIKTNIKQSSLENMVTDYYEEKEGPKERFSLIVVSMNSMNDTLQKTIKQLWKKYNEYVALMDINSLQFNLLEHSFVPKHEKLSSIEKDELYKHFNIEHDKQMPEISMFDPVAKVILLKPGQVTKIIRHDKISLENVFYRVCVI